MQNPEDFFRVNILFHCFFILIVELSSVCDAIFRTHEGLNPEKLVQVYNNHEIASIFGKFTKIHSALGLYRKKLMIDDMSTYGIPLSRHMLVHYWNDPNVFTIHDQFLLGTEFMMAPAFDAGQTKVRIYIPKLKPDSNILAKDTIWVHMLTGEEIKRTGWVELEVPLGQPVILHKKESMDAALVVEDLNSNLINQESQFSITKI